MNPLALIRCAGRLFMALAATSGIFFLAGCGSGNPVIPPNQVGFTKGSLKGTYVFSAQGADAFSGAPLALAGALVADGNGGITGGMLDVVDIAVGGVIPVAQAITGSYGVTTDGRGQAQLNSTVYGTFVLDFVLTSTSHGLVTEFDSNGGGSGTIDLQTAIPSLAQLAGPYAFILAGSDSGGFPFASTGAFTLNGSGASTAGVQDFNDNAVPFIKTALTAAATAASGTNPGTMTLTSDFGPLLFDFYPIDATHFKLIETDNSLAFLAGDVFTQTGAVIPNGAMVFTMSGGTNLPVADGGLMTSDGAGNFPSGLEDINNGGSVTPQLGFSGALNAAASGPTGGRVVVDLNSFFPATQWVIYPSSGGLLLLETDSGNVTVGTAFAQQAGAALAPSKPYGFNLAAFNITGPNLEDDIAQFTTTSTGFKGVVDINDNFGNINFLSSAALTGSYTLDSPATGRGEATTTAGGNTFVGFTFYAVDASTILLLETDNNQIGTGIFQMQTPPAEDMAHSHISPVHPTVFRPAVRPQGAPRHK
jgi:hypothetical protein